MRRTLPDRQTQMGFSKGHLPMGRRAVGSALRFTPPILLRVPPLTPLIATASIESPAGGTNAPKGQELKLFWKEHDKRRVKFPVGAGLLPGSQRRRVGDVQFFTETGSLKANGVGRRSFAHWKANCKSRDCAPNDKRANGCSVRIGCGDPRSQTRDLGHPSLFLRDGFVEVKWVVGKNHLPHRKGNCRSRSLHRDREKRERSFQWEYG
jgi:hypothetical protein